MILSGDIGGTKTNLAYFETEGNDLVPILVKSYPSQEFSSLPEVIERMQRDHPATIRAAAFGIAGPIVEGRSKLTNLGWEVDAREVAACLHLDGVGLLNDLEATAYGILRLPASENVFLQHGKAQPHRAIAVIAAGTGLGEGGLFWDGEGYRAIPSEGGHTDFGPRNDLEVDLLRYLLTRYGRASYERIVSGPGLQNLYEFFRLRAGYPEPSWLTEQFVSGDPSAAISRAAMEEKDPVCVQSLDLFVSLYGAETGNLALKLVATGGVFIGGGIAPKIVQKLLQRSFLESFFKKGRYETLLRQIPVQVVLNDKTALIGAAHYATLKSGRDR